MELTSEVRAILFDLDGTLVDTAPDISAAVEATLGELELPPLEFERVRGYIGRGVEVLLHRILTGEREGTADAELHARAREVFFREYEASNGRTAKVYPGAREALARAQALGLKLCCVTNKLQGYSEALLAKVGLDRYLEFVQGGDALPQRKPDPEPLLHAARRLGVAASACLMVGDSANDANAARAAGMPVVLVSYGYTEDMPVESIACDAIVPSIGDVVDAIEAYAPAHRAARA